MATVFIRAANPIWFFNDLTGVVLNDEYYAFFLTNTLPYIPQAVYQDPAGSTQWSNPIEFSPAGSMPSNLYFDPNLVYRIEIRHGNTQADALIWEINDFVPGEGGGSALIENELTVAANLITDPQFADIYFVSPFTYTQVAPDTYTVPIGPGWDLVLTGTGTSIITQGENAGSANIAENPPYYIDINNSGWTTAVLRQRLANNGAIFANGAIAVSLMANSVSVPETLTVSYAPSSGTATNILSRSIPTGALVAYSGAIDLPSSTNASTGTNAYVDILFTLPGTGEMALTNIQVVGQSTPLSDIFDATTDIPAFRELTYEQVVNAEFNVYRNSIILMPKDSVLVGWNFGLNPWQFTATDQENVAANQYIADQTIVIQQNYVANAVGNNVQSVRQSSSYNYAFHLNAVTAHNQFGILQYIDPASIRPYWLYKLSSLVNAQLTSTHATAVKFKMRLIYIADLPSSTSQHYPVASWAEGGDPVFAAGITAIIPPNDPIYTLSDNSTGAFINSNNLFPFNGMQLPAADIMTQNMTLGIFIYTIDNMNQNATPDGVSFFDISLVPNDFAIASNPKTFDETLRECQYYYAKTFAQGVVPDESAPAGSPSALQYQTFLTGASTTSLYWQFPVAMRSETPTMHYYSSDLPTSNRWYNLTTAAASGTASTGVISDRGVRIDNPQDGSMDTSGDLLALQATADARLGL